MQNKTYIFLNIFNMISRCFVVFLLYKYAFNINGSCISRIDYKTTLWSMFIYFCVMTLNIRRIVDIIMVDVKSGNVEMFLNKPISYIKLCICKVIGQGIYSFVVIGMGGTIIMILLVGLPQINMCLFIPSIVITLLLGIILSLLLYSCIGLLSFFMQDVRPLYWIVDKLVMVLGGSYLPVIMFPWFVKLIAYTSPFGAINFATSTVYEFWNSKFVARVGLQILWIFVFGMLLRTVYKKACEKAMINGG